MAFPGGKPPDTVENISQKMKISCNINYKTYTKILSLHTYRYIYKRVIRCKDELHPILWSQFIFAILEFLHINLIKC